ncbi:leucine-rich repeat protein [uncultured Prevotella sp.]|uniref:leucine-rich repeat protein n=1 Tax=uncultured Prevotella sp. TaxID=159272 RepID=UPI0025EBCB39|nr:leucine-rich repeat protein [uncultured Prevotella sp.]
MKRHFSKQSLLRTMMIVATLLFMMPAQNAWADNVATATVDGNTYTYSSLEAAVSAANGAQSTATVTLLKDITEQPCSLEVKKPMIIDLNNHRINTTTNYYLFYIYLSNGQQMTIMNGSIRGRQNDVYIYKGEAVLENITAEAPSSGSDCVYICNTCSLTISKSITFDASIYNQGYVKIASGQKLYDKNGIEYSGYINSRVANLANNTLSYLVTVTANGTTTPYNSLQDAVSAAANAYTTYGTAATITLNHDITAQTCSLEVRKPMIIDLNGHVVNANNLNYGYGIFSIMNAEGQVIIKNGTISRRGVNDYNGFAIYNYNSNVELENVTVKNTYSTDNPCLYNSGTLTISKNITLVGSIKNSDSGTVQIVDGQLLGDASGKYYLGTLTSAQVDALSNNTLSSLSVVASGSCGTYVKWALTGTSPNYTLTISGTGNMADYSLTNRPWVNYLAGIVTVVIEDGVKSIGSDAFRNCTSLESVTIPASVTSIGDYAFNNCTGLTSVTIPASVMYIGENAFCDTGLTTITIPASVTSIGNNAFANCKLTSITLSEGLTTISAYAFSNNGTTIESVSIPQSVTSIGNCAFNGTSVQNFYINNVPSVLAIGENSPFKSSGVTIHVFTLMKSIFENATNWSKYKSHFVDDIEITHVESVTLDNESMIVKTNASGKLNATINPADARVKDVVFTSSNDNIVHITDAATGEFLAGSQNGTATITCTALDGSGAYATCNVEVNNYLTPAESVTLNKTTNSLEVGGQFNLTATIYPLNVTYKNIVWRTSDETVATVNDGTVTAVAPGITTITAISQDGQARANCVVSVIGSCGTGVTWVLTGTSPNYTLTISGTGAMKDYGTPDDLPWKDYRSLIASVVIENGVTSIGNMAFEGCNNANLTSVTIPVSVERIGDYAFAFCSNLTIDLDAFLAKNIRFGDNAFYQISCLTGSLADNGNNTDKIKMLSKATANVTLSGRTLYKDGNWNTICLPFSLGNFSADEGHHFDGTPLEGATVMELKVADSEFDAASGTLSLFFTDAKSISAGTPYIVKWEGDGTNNLVNPLFTGVKVFTDAPTPVQSHDEKVQFRGIYSSTNIYSADHDNLFLGIGKNNQNEDVSMLYWPNTEGYTLGAFRAYFHVDLTETNGVRDIVLNFEDGTQTTGIIGHTDNTDNTDKADAAWYSLDGRKLDAKPSSKGIYIHGGRKTVIK